MSRSLSNYLVFLALLSACAPIQPKPDPAAPAPPARTEPYVLRAEIDPEDVNFQPRKFTSRSEAVAVAQDLILRIPDHQPGGGHEFVMAEPTAMGLKLVFRMGPKTEEWRVQECYLTAHGVRRSVVFRGRDKIYRPFGCYTLETDSLELISAVISVVLYLADHKPLGIPEIEKELEKFELAAMRVRATGARATLPEASRPLKAEAEANFAARKHLLAAWAYGKLLGKKPAWSGGYFNQALLLDSAGFPDEAYLAMRKYLALVPEKPVPAAALNQLRKIEANLARQKAK